MLLTEQGESANALHDVVLPTVRRQFVMNRKRSHAGQGSGTFAEGFEIVYLQIKAIRKKPAKFSIGTDRQQPLGRIKNKRRSDWSAALPGPRAVPGSQRARILGCTETDLDIRLRGPGSRSVFGGLRAVFKFSFTPCRI